MFQRSVVLVRNDGTLPFHRGTGTRTLVAGVSNINIFGGPTVSHVETAATVAREISGGDVRSWTSAGEDPTDEEIAEAESLALGSDRVVVLTYTRGELPQGQARLVRRLKGTGKPLVAVATSTPYDLMSYPDVGAYIAGFTFGFAPTHLATTEGLRAVMEVLFGREPTGRLPVSIPGLYPVGHGLSYAGG
jgi:beta-N-acetylhexosaminidase